MPFRNPADRAAYNAAYGKAKRDAFLDLIQKAKNRPCVDCGTKSPVYVMDFDHRPDEVKVRNISHMGSYSLDKVRAEIGKCDVICANCHRERTYGN